MPTSERGDFENPKKSAYSVERYDSSWELEYMKRLDRDRTVAKWTKNHGIAIQYVTEAGNVRGYHPDFLLERVRRHEGACTKSKAANISTTRTRSANMRPRRIGVGSVG